MRRWRSSWCQFLRGGGLPVGHEIRRRRWGGRIVIAGDACARGSYLNDIAANITEMAFDDLDAAPVVLGSRNWITPCRELEEAFFPQPSWFLDAINEKIVPLKDYVPVSNQTTAEQVIRAKKGV